MNSTSELVVRDTQKRTLLPQQGGGQDGDIFLNGRVEGLQRQLLLEEGEAVRDFGKGWEEKQELEKKRRAMKESQDKGCQFERGNKKSYGLWRLGEETKEKQKKKLKQRVKDGEFISLNHLGSKFITVKYLLLSTLISFAATQIFWMICCGHLRLIYLLLVLGMDITSYIQPFC